MRLFLMAVLCGSVLAGCKKDDSKAGALNVTIGYSGFTRGCVTVTATDVDDAQNTNTLNVAIPGKTPGSVAVAVFREKDWGRVLNVTTQLREFDCDGTAVGDPQEMKARVPEEGKLDVAFTVSATDGDNDGYYSVGSKGSDCDDGNVNVNPGAAIDGRTDFYPDVDGDTFGALNATATRACTAPIGFVEDHSDCDDTTQDIRPGITESRCDGKDDNCNGATDEVFSVGAACSGPLACGGAIQCNIVTKLAECAVTQQPEQWFTDVDGDGAPGVDAGFSCGVPPNTADAGTVNQDCDESSIFVKKSLPDVCDRLNNDCADEVDDGCAPLTWTTDAGVEGTTNLTAIALYGSGQASWIVGLNKVVHLNGTTASVFNHSSCDGNWQAAWASNDGRVFMVGNNGMLATRIPSEADPKCFVRTTSDKEPLNGVFGIENPTGGATVYAVASNGKIYRWAAPYNEENNLFEMAPVGANLRAIGGAKKADTLLAVGSGNEDGGARAFRFNPTGVNWSEESLGDTDAGFLRGVHVLNSQYAYAAGDNGHVFERTDGGDWHPLDRVTTADGGTATDVLDILAFSKNGIYAVTTGNTIEFFDGNSWDTVYSGEVKLKSLDGPTPTRFGAAGDGSNIVNFTAPPLP
ncbi:putative metal-binding motif-containing protein [Corallococcus sp. BB11-1]|uniref:putative metal-binding motif-containing protein n=1 Tax=Corallococcus sp. BB11-1 TaxID=2996783 RepID=UPI0022718C81|nr:putative metal-binding motif-containing protein [Corallococcus sp. BB11-1]MCY1036658.1 putative metal-binding motif-containing protein [Corallococcus sp. BB11-1]